MTARAFFEFYGIEYRHRKQRAYRPEWDEDFGGLIVLLGRPPARKEQADPDDGEGTREGDPENEEPPEEASASPSG